LISAWLDGRAEKQGNGTDMAWHNEVP